MSGDGEYDAGRLRPPMHPTRSSAPYSIPSSPANSASRPPIHPSHPLAQLSPANLSPIAPPAPPAHPSSRLSPALPPRPTGGSPQITPLPAQSAPSGYDLEAYLHEGSVAQPPSLLPPKLSRPSPSVLSSSGLSLPVQPIFVEGNQGSEDEVEAPTTTLPPSGLGAGPSTETLSSIGSKDEEELSEFQLRELYDDEEIDRFLKVFSTVSFLVSSCHPSTKTERETLSMSGRCEQHSLSRWCPSMPGNPRP